MSRKGSGQEGEQGGVVRREGCIGTEEERVEGGGRGERRRGEKGREEGERGGCMEGAEGGQRLEDQA